MLDKSRKIPVAAAGRLLNYPRPPEEPKAAGIQHVPLQGPGRIIDVATPSLHQKSACFECCGYFIYEYGVSGSAVGSRCMMDAEEYVMMGEAGNLEIAMADCANFNCRRLSVKIVLDNIPQALDFRAGISVVKDSDKIHKTIDCYGINISAIKNHPLGAGQIRRRDAKSSGALGYPACRSARLSQETACKFQSISKDGPIAEGQRQSY
ncbi:MAG: hypothetical protein PHD91_01875 [bacterium]|nr:hypothetical protein [bacterium]